MAMTIIAKVEVEKSSLKKSIWQFYVRMAIGYKLWLVSSNMGKSFYHLINIHMHVKISQSADNVMILLYILECKKKCCTKHLHK